MAIFSTVAIFPTLIALLVVRTNAGAGGNASSSSKACGPGLGKTKCDPCKIAFGATTPLTMTGPEVTDPGVFYFKFKFGAASQAAPANLPRYVTFSEGQAVTGTKTMNKYYLNFKAGGCPTEKGTVLLDVWGDASVDHRSTAMFKPDSQSGDLEIYARVDFKDAGTCTGNNCAYKVSSCGAGVIGLSRDVRQGDWNKICATTTTTTSTTTTKTTTTDPDATTTTTSAPYKYNISDPKDCSRYGQDNAIYECSAALKPKCCCGHTLAGQTADSLQCLKPHFITAASTLCPSAPKPVAGPCPTEVPVAVPVAGARMAVSLLMAPVLSVGVVLFMA